MEVYKHVSADGGLDLIDQDEYICEPMDLQEAEKLILKAYAKSLEGSTNKETKNE